MIHTTYVVEFYNGWRLNSENLTNLQRADRKPVQSVVLFLFMNSPMEPHGSTLKREFTLWSSFAFAFAFISPIVALYGIFGLAIAAAGPAFWWGFPVVLAGQLLVALIFATLVSRWPIEGSVYQWSARLIGKGYGWFAGWAYMWTLVIAMATVALGAAGFLLGALGVEGPSDTALAWTALGILLAGTAVNLAGRGVLKTFMFGSIIAEVLGSLGLGIWLLLFHREHSLDILFNGPDGAAVDATYFALGGPFLLGMAFIGFSFVGFESAGSIAEEVKDPRRNLPKAILVSLVFIAAVVMFSSLSIILAIPDMGQIASGNIGDTISYVLVTQLGPQIAVPIQALFTVGFVASFLALQTSSSRIIWSFARDGALPGSRILSRLTRGQRQPAGALLVTTVVGALLVLLSTSAKDLYTLMVNFTAGGFYVAFLFPLIGFLIVRLRRRWVTGPFTLRGATLPVALLAVAWCLFEVLNIAWPRPVYDNPMLNWSVWIGLAGIGAIGAAVYSTVRHRIPDVVGKEFPDDPEVLPDADFHNASVPDVQRSKGSQI